MTEANRTDACSQNCIPNPVRRIPHAGVKGGPYRSEYPVWWRPSGKANLAVPGGRGTEYERCANGSADDGGADPSGGRVKS